MTAQTIAAAIVETRKALGKMEAYPGPAPEDLSQALAIQDEVVRQFGEPVAGWKIGCTSKTAQETLGTDGPFFGPLIGSRFYASRARVETAPTSLRVVEPEIALRLGRDIAPRSEPYSVDEVMAAVETVHPSLEVIDRRLPGGFADGVLWHVTDCGLSDALVLGAGTSGIAADALPGIAVEARVNGEVVSTGHGRNALDGPQLALQWIANTFSSLGRTLEAGQVVSTGLLTSIFTLNPGDEIEAEYEKLGTVSAKVL
ncbi:MAG: fumarylacetoacetate hydrolase family protein [Pseudomonadota bacterium]